METNPVSPAVISTTHLNLLLWDLTFNGFSREPCQSTPGPTLSWRTKYCRCWHWANMTSLTRRRGRSRGGWCWCTDSLGGAPSPYSSSKSSRWPPSLPRGGRTWPPTSPPLLRTSWAPLSAQQACCCSLNLLSNQTLTHKRQGLHPGSWAKGRKTAQGTGSRKDRCTQALKESLLFPRQPLLSTTLKQPQPEGEKKRQRSINHHKVAKHKEKSLSHLLTMKLWLNQLTSKVLRILIHNYFPNPPYTHATVWIFNASPRSMC